MKIQDITLGQYAARDSVIHKLDPRTKLISCFVFMSFLLITHRIEVILILFSIIVVLFRLSNLNLRLAIRNIRPFIWLFLVTIILHILLTKGKILWNVPWIGLTVTREGIFQGFFYTFRIGILIIIAALLTLTTSPMAITDALERFLSPFKRIGIPAHEIAMMISIAIRFIPILVQESDRIQKAQVSRGNRLDGKLIQKVKSVLPLVIPLFLSTFRRANELAFAMDSRCYRGGDQRTNYYILKFKSADLIALLLVISIGFPVVLIR
jgi:energy-coupling factor transport system permease protein